MAVARARAAAAAGAAITGGDAADDAAVAVVMRPWRRDRPDASGFVFADRLWADARSYMARRMAGGAMPWQAAFIAWLSSRGATAAPTTVERYARHVSTRLDAWLRSSPGPPIPGSAPSALRDPEVRRYLKRLGMMWGRSRVRGPRRALEWSEYDAFRRDVSVPVAIRRVVVVAWERKGRVGDVLETRSGGIGMMRQVPPDVRVPPGASVHVVEQPFHKAAPGGSWARVPMVLDSTARAVLGPLAPDAPLSMESPMHRPLLFPTLSTRDVYAALANSVGGSPGAHSIRRGAMRHALAGGMSTRTLMRFTLHQTEEALLAYAAGPDPEDVRHLTESAGGAPAGASSPPRTRRRR